MKIHLQNSSRKTHVTSRWSEFRVSSILELLRQACSKGDMTLSSLLWNRHFDTSFLDSLDNLLTDIPHSVGFKSLLTWLDKYVIPKLSTTEHWTTLAIWMSSFSIHYPPKRALEFLNLVMIV